MAKPMINNEAEARRAARLVQTVKLPPEKRDRIMKELRAYSERSPSERVNARFGDSIALGTDRPPTVARARAGAEQLAGGLFDRVREVGAVLQRPFQTVPEVVEAQRAEIVRQQKIAQEQAKRAQEAGVDVPVEALEGVRTAGQFGFDAVIGGVAGAGRGITARFAREGLAGGLTGLTQDPYAEVTTMLSNAAIGSGSGMLLSLGLDTPDIIRTMAVGNVRRAFRQRFGQVRPDDPFQPDHVSQLARIDVTPGESTGDDLIQLAERQIPVTPGGPKEQFIRRRQEQALTRFNEISTSLSRSQASTPAVIEQTKRAYDATVGELRTAAQQGFREDIRPGLEAVGARMGDDGLITGGARVIPATGYIDTLNRQRTQLAEVGDEAAVRAIDRELDFLEQNGGRLTLGGLQKMLKDLTEESYGTGTTAQQAIQAGRRVDSRLLLNALLRDVDTAADTLEATARPIDAFVETGAQAAPRRGARTAQAVDLPGQARGPRGEELLPGQRGEELRTEAFELDVEPAQAQAAAQALRTARQNYAASMAPLNALQKQGIDNLLGSTKVLGSQEFTDSYLALPFDQKKQVMELLEARRPELANTLRQRVWLETLQDSIRPAQRGEVPEEGIPGILDFNRFAKRIADGSTRELSLMLPAGTSVQDARRVQAGLQWLNQRMQTFNREGASGAGFQGVVNSMKETSINLMSRHAGFVARWLVGKASPHALERWLYTPRGLQLLLKAGDPQPLKGAAANATVAGLLELALESEEDIKQLKEDAARQAQQAQRAQQIEQRREARGQ